MKLKPTNLNIRASATEKAMLEQVAKAHETTPSEMMRQLIRDAYAKMLAEQDTKNGEMKMKSYFDSLDEALDYGHELKSRVSHRDETRGGWGYDLTADDGREAVPVNTGELTDMEKAHGKSGKGGLIRMMFPPRQKQ